MKTMAAVMLAAVAGSAQGYTWTHDGVEHNGKLGKTMNPTICDPNVKQYAGHYEIDQGKKSYFYWAFAARNNASGADTPTILWMTGGPGCSSELALLYENGPCHANAAGTGTVNNPFSWNTDANIVYIDQPAGVGFSTGDETDKDEAGVSADMYAFLQSFFKDHPSWNKNFYVFGESYGGHYAPATAHKIWAGGKAGEGIKIDLAGLAVGNGLTDPEIQYQYYAQQGFNWSKTIQGHSVFTQAQYDRMQGEIAGCVKAIHSCNEGGNAIVCDYAKFVCNLEFLSPYTETGLNPYDMTKKCAVPPLCYDFSNVDTYLNSKELQTALGVNTKWVSCNDGVNARFGADWMKNYQDQVPDLLANGVRVLIYAGDYDYVCNWLGNKAWTLALPWAGKAGFNAATDKSWMVAGKDAGKIRTHAGFSFLQVHAAGHMVPHDQPQAALQMVHSFIFNKPF